MNTYRKWYCSCRGTPVELAPLEIGDDEPLEPVCQRCGATPSSDPRHTISFRDTEDRDV